MATQIIIQADEYSVSDGHHTMGELYEHRNILFIALLKAITDAGIHQSPPCLTWISKREHDGASHPGWFLAGIKLGGAGNITYHLPNTLWDIATITGAKVLSKAPPWDDHTSKDVYDRLEAWVLGVPYEMEDNIDEEYYPGG
jgi:hypothetical protein